MFSIYTRKSPNPDENDIYVALNMVPVPLEDYKMPVYELGTYKIVMNTDDMVHGGSGYPTGTDAEGCFEAIDEPYNGKPYHVQINLPPLAGIYFMKVKDPAPKLPAKKAAAKKPAVKKTSAKKPAAKKAEKKAEEPKKAEVKKATAKKAEPEKKETKKPAAKKAAAKKAEEKKPAAKKETASKASKTENKK